MNFACRDHLPSIAHRGSPQPNQPLCPAPAPPLPMPALSCLQHQCSLRNARRQRGKSLRTKRGRGKAAPRQLAPGAAPDQAPQQQLPLPAGEWALNQEQVLATLTRGTACPRCRPAGSCKEMEARAMLRLSLLPKAPHTPPSPPTADGQTQRAGLCTAAHRAYPTASPCTTAARRGEGDWGGGEGGGSDGQQ